MTAKALKALKASIAHWRRLAEGKERKGERPGRSDCALCDAFIDRGMCGCEGCPVAAHTTLPSCLNTPFRAAYEAWWIRGASSPRFRKAAQRELVFLESLLPKGKAKP